jgi:hypothetical protein
MAGSSKKDIRSGNIPLFTDLSLKSDGTGMGRHSYSAGQRQGAATSCLHSTYEWLSIGSDTHSNAVCDGIQILESET